MKAAVVTAFTRPSRSWSGTSRPRRAARCSCGWRRAGCATPTSTPPAATGRSSRPRRSSPATRASASSSSSATASPSRRVGERVAIAWLGSACGACRYCVDGRETLCEQQQNSGYSVDGAFAEYAVADAAYVVRCPDGVTSVDAAPLTCAGVTTYKALKVAQVAPTERVGVFGIGGLGHLAVQYAQIMGGTVVAVDIEQAKLDLARELGAEHCVNAGATEPVAALQELGGLDVAVVLAASPRLRAGLRLAAPRRTSGLRGHARRRRSDDHPDLRDSGQGPLHHRLDRGDPAGPGRGVRPARGRPDAGHRRDPRPGRRQHVRSRRCCRAASPPGWCSSMRRSRRRSPSSAESRDRHSRAPPVRPLPAPRSPSSTCSGCRWGPAAPPAWSG